MDPSQRDLRAFWLDVALTARGPDTRIRGAFAWPRKRARTLGKTQSSHRVSVQGPANQRPRKRQSMTNNRNREPSKAATVDPEDQRAFPGDVPGGKSICLCAHRGDGSVSEHDGVIRHGACLVPECGCEKFSWASFINEGKENSW